MDPRDRGRAAKKQVKGLRITSGLFAVAGEDFRRTLGRVSFRVMLLIVPVLLLVALATVAIVKSSPATVQSSVWGNRTGLVDLSGLVDPEASAAAGLRVYATKDEGVRELTTGDVDTVFVVPADYLQSGQVDWLHSGSSITANFVQEGQRAGLQGLLLNALLDDSLPQDVENRFLSPADVAPLVVQSEGQTRTGFNPQSYLSMSYFFALILVFAVLIGAGYLLQSISDEKENRMIEILLTSVSPREVMAGKVLALGAAGLLQVAVWGASVALVLPRILDWFPDLGQFAVGGSILVWLVCFFLLGYFVVGIVLVTIGACTATYYEASQIAVPIYIAVVIPFQLYSMFAGDPFGIVARTLSFFPLTAPVTMMLRLSVANVSLPEILGTLCGTAAIGILVLVLASRVFGAGLLVYGQKLSVVQIVRAVRSG